MKPLDDPSLFKYKRSKPEPKAQITPQNQPAQPSTFFHTYVSLFQSRESTSLGQYIISILAGQTGSQLLVYKQNQQPVINLTCTQNIFWNFMNSQMVQLVDFQNVVWSLNFRDAQEAAKCTATLCLTSLPSQDFGYFPGVSHPGRSLRPGDGAEISGIVYSVSNFPYVENFVSQFEPLRIMVNNQKLALGVLRAIEGMVQNSSRAIFLPPNLQLLSNGERSPRLPGVNCVLILTVHRTNFHDEDEQPKAPKVSISETKSQPFVSVLPEESIEPNPRDEKFLTLERIKKLGGVRSGLVPALQKDNEKDPPKEQEPLQRNSDFDTFFNEDSQPSKRKTPEKSKISDKISSLNEFIEAPYFVPPGSENPSSELRAERYESSSSRDEVIVVDKALHEKLDRIISVFYGGSSQEPDALISGVTKLSIQLKSSQAENESLKKQLSEMKSNQTRMSLSPKQIEILQRENEDFRRKFSQTERKLSDAESRVKQLLLTEKENKAAACNRSIDIVKLMMSSVFDEMSSTFDSEQKYTGEEISDKLAILLRKHSFTAFQDINTNGLY